MTKIIINADDFGYSKGVNHGIIEAHKDGVVTSTTLMVTMPGAEHGVALMKENRKLAVGLHLNISLGKPLTSGKTLVGRDNQFMKPDALPEGYIYDENELQEELWAQYDKYIELVGNKPSHIDSHLFSSDKVPQMRKLCAQLAREKGIPMRNFDMDYAKHVEFIQYRKFNAKPNLDYILEYFDEILKYDYIEIMTHPGYVDHYLMENSSYDLQRAEEVKFLTSKRLKDLMNLKKVELITYYDVMI